MQHCKLQRASCPCPNKKARMQQQQRQQKQRQASPPATDTEGGSLPPRMGPKSLADVLQCLKDPVGRIAKVLRHRWPNLSQLHGGSSTDAWQELWITTSYSGIGFAEASIVELQRELAAIGLTVKVKFASACELEEVPRQALLQHKHGPEHVFGDITSRIPSELRDALLAKAKAHREHVQHQVNIARSCGEDPKKIKAQLVAELGQEFFHEVTSALEVAPLSSHSWCYRHAQMCPVQVIQEGSLQEGGLSPHHILRLEIAGTTCVAWSQMGVRWGWLDDSCIPCLVWMFATAAARPDLVLHERTVHFQPARFRPVFQSELYSLQTLKSRPSLWGIPVERPRRYTLLVLRSRRKEGLHEQLGKNSPTRSAITARSADHMSKRRKVGPGQGSQTSLPLLAANSLDFTPEVMAAVCFAKLQTHCGIYLKASKDQVKDLYLKRVQASSSQSSSFAGGRWSELGIMDVICPSARVHLEACQELHADGKLGRDLVSLSQSPWFMRQNKLSAFVPVLVRNSQLYSMSRRRLVLPEEALQMQGLPVPALLSDLPDLATRWPFKCDFHDIMTETQMRTATGNGMHICQVGSAVLLAVAMLAGGPEPDVKAQPDVLASSTHKEA